MGCNKRGGGELAVMHQHICLIVLSVRSQLNRGAKTVTNDEFKSKVFLAQCANIVKIQAFCGYVFNKKVAN